jgi:hypothetical protein
VCSLFPIKYENVPFFCFSCGRIGHTQRTCPDDFFACSGVCFGTDLRASPTRRSDIKEIKIPANSLGSKRALNFCGAQRSRALSGVSGPNVQAIQRSSRPADQRASRNHVAMADQKNKGEDDERVSPVMAPDVRSLLEQGVKRIAVQQVDSDLNLATGDSVMKGKALVRLDYDIPDASSVDGGMVPRMEEAERIDDPDVIMP